MGQLHVLIDNGHGWDTIGKQSPDGRLREYSYTRKVARILCDKLKAQGYPCTLITPEDNDIRLSERVNRVNNICKDDNCILVSIHCDAQNDKGKWGPAKGFSVWTYTKCSENSKKLARCFVDTVQSCDLAVRKYNNDIMPFWPANLKILKETNCPAVLTENFFQDNQDDVEWLLANAETVADYHLAAIQQYEALIQKCV